MAEEQELSYSEQYAALEALVDKLGRGGLTIDEMRAMTLEADSLLRQCYGMLHSTQALVEEKVAGWEGLSGPEGQPGTDDVEKI